MGCIGTDLWRRGSTGAKTRGPLQEPVAGGLELARGFEVMLRMALAMCHALECVLVHTPSYFTFLITSFSDEETRAQRGLVASQSLRTHRQCRFPPWPAALPNSGSSEPPTACCQYPGSLPDSRRKSLKAGLIGRRGISANLARCANPRQGPPLTLPPSAGCWKSPFLFP